MKMKLGEVGAVMSPINKAPSSKSRVDHLEQMARSTDKMWDDAKGNPTQEAGGVFGFVHNGDRVEIHMVVGTNEPSDRVLTWSENVGQTNRDVLKLSPKVCEINWVDWLSFGGARRIQGTTRVVGAHDGLHTHLRGVLGGVVYIESEDACYLKI